MGKKKLTKEQREEITNRWDKRPTVKSLAAEFSVAENTIKSVIYKWQARKLAAWKD